MQQRYLIFFGILIFALSGQSAYYDEDNDSNSEFEKITDELILQWKDATDEVSRLKFQITQHKEITNKQLKNIELSQLIHHEEVNLSPLYVAVGVANTKAFQKIVQHAHTKGTTLEMFLPIIGALHNNNASIVLAALNLVQIKKATLDLEVNLIADIVDELLIRFSLFNHPSQSIDILKKLVACGAKFDYKKADLNEYLQSRIQLPIFTIFNIYLLKKSDPILSTISKQILSFLIQNGALLNNENKYSILHLITQNGNKAAELTSYQSDMLDLLKLKRSVDIAKSTPLTYPFNEWQGHMFEKVYNEIKETWRDLQEQINSDSATNEENFDETYPPNTETLIIDANNSFTLTSMQPLETEEDILNVFKSHIKGFNDLMWLSDEQSAELFSIVSQSPLFTACLVMSKDKWGYSPLDYARYHNKEHTGFALQKFINE